MWQMQVNVGQKDPPDWVSVKATNAEEPYEYDTEKEAAHMLNICYPDQCREDRLGGHPRWCRVIEVPKRCCKCGEPVLEEQLVGDELCDGCSEGS